VKSPSRRSVIGFGSLVVAGYLVIPDVLAYRHLRQVTRALSTSRRASPFAD
jgi:hypothetical protein